MNCFEFRKIVQIFYLSTHNIYEDFKIQFQRRIEINNEYKIICTVDWIGFKLRNCALDYVKFLGSIKIGLKRSFFPFTLPFY